MCNRDFLSELMNFIPRSEITYSCDLGVGESKKPIQSSALMQYFNSLGFNLVFSSFKRIKGNIKPLLWSSAYLSNPMTFGKSFGAKCFGGQSLVVYAEK